MRTMYGVGAGLRSDVGILLQPLAAQCGVEYADVSMCAAVMQIVFGAIQPLFGMLAPVLTLVPVALVVTSRDPKRSDARESYGDKEGAGDDGTVATAEPGSAYGGAAAATGGSAAIWTIDVAACAFACIMSMRIKEAPLALGTRPLMR